MPTQTFIIGGAGTAADKSDSNGGGFRTGYNATWANSQGANGGSIFSSTVDWSATVAEGSGSQTAVSKTGIGVNAKTGTFCDCDFDAGIADDRYFIIAVNSDDQITIAATWNPGASTVKIVIGGALETLGEANGDITDGTDTEVKISIDLVITGAVTFVSGGDNEDNTKWLRIQGVSGVDGSVLPEGEYIIIDRGGASNVIVWDDIDNAELRAIHITGAGSVGLFINNGGTGYNYRIISCKFTACKYGLYTISTNVWNVLVYDCDFSLNTTNDVRDGSSGPTFVNCSFSSDLAVQVTVDRSGVFVGCSFVDGEKGLRHVSYFPTTVIGCVFYNQSVACIENVHARGSIVAYNNSFMPATAAAKAILVTGGSILFADYNDMWNVDTDEACDSDVSGDNDLAVDPLFMDAANDNFSLLPTSGLWNKGKRTLNDGYTTPGSWNRINLPLREE